MTRQPRHATVVALYRQGRWHGVMLEGPSGSGKSDLALRLIRQCGAALVTDDRALVFPSGGQLYASAPAAIAGMMEMRGLGIVPRPFLSPVRIRLRVEAAQTEPERLPEPRTTDIEGVSVPTLSLCLPRPATPHMIAVAVETL